MNQEDVIRLLSEIGELRDKGVLSESEFQEQKSLLLATLDTIRTSDRQAAPSTVQMGDEEMERFINSYYGDNDPLEQVVQQEFRAGHSQPILRNCPECGSRVLQETESCPECGFPLHEERDFSIDKSSFEPDAIRSNSFIAPSRYVPVGFWQRVLASLIDFGIVLGVSLFALYELYGPDYFFQFTVSQGSQPFEVFDKMLWFMKNFQFRDPLDRFINQGFPAIYTLVFWAICCTTPGKMAVSAKIIDAETGEPPTLGQLVGRYLAYFVSIIPLFLGIFWVAFDRNKQGWHDKISGTLVVKKTNERDWIEFK